MTTTPEPALSPSGESDPTAHRLPVASGAETWRQVRGLLRGRRRALTCTTLLLLAGSAAALLLPLGLGYIVDAVIDRANVTTLAAAAGVVVVAGLGSALLLRWGGRLLVTALQGMLAELREQVFATAMRLEQGKLEAAGTADVVSRVTGDVEATTGAVSEVLPRFVQAGFTIVLTAVALFTLDPWLAGAALIAVPVQVVATARFLRRSRPLYRQLRREESDRGQAIIESVRGAETVIAHSTQAVHLQRVATRSLNAVQTARVVTRARNRFNAGLNTAEFLGLAAILAVGYWQSVSAGLTVGAVTAAALFFHRLFGPIGALLSSLDDLQRATAGLSRLVGVLQATPPHTIPEQIMDSGISLRRVCYRYQRHSGAALAEVSLDFAPGTTTLLIGVSGSGKSTLAQLIAGVFPPTAGEVRIGGVPATHAVAGTRPAVQLITQDIHVFAGTLAENLRLAAPRAAEPQLWQALDRVGAHWAHGLPEGLQHPLDHDLDDASVQQLALARVILADPAVVVLDEATAHGGADGALDEAVRAVIDGRTAVIVAHRFTHAAVADRIVVLEHGRVLEQGTHAELLARPAGSYAKLHAASMR